MRTRGFTIRNSIPALAGWSSDFHAGASLVIVALTVLGAEWIVHQTEYLIEYGQRFGFVMETTPHRLYMSILGAALALGGLLLCALITLILQLGTARLRRVLAGLPPWVRRRVPGERIRVPLGGVLQTALILLLLQVAVYLVQENLEALAQYADAPGLAVLFAPQHVTVIPLHILMAGAASLLLWIVSSWLRALHVAVTVAEVLLRLTLRWALPAPLPLPLIAPVARRRLATSRRSLRSPPLAA
jgi:hypothetical protein